LGARSSRPLLRITMRPNSSQFWAPSSN